LAVVVTAATAAAVVLGALAETLAGQNVDYPIANPIGIPGMPPLEEGPFFAPIGIVFICGLLGATAAMVVRFRRSRGMERQQLKWFFFAAALLPLMATAEYLPVFGGVILAVILIALPVAIGVAVLRYRLYDIDLIIRRTLVYSVLTAALALVYFGSVAVLQGVFTALSGQPSTAAVVASTLAIAAIFAPLRRRLQDFIDRRFYRRKYDAVRTLAEFGAHARDETDLDRLAARLVGLVSETVQPAHVSLWLAPGRGVARPQTGANDGQS
jgi:hypothetical protein